jgi:hypothetical protein
LSMEKLMKPIQLISPPNLHIQCFQPAAPAVGQQQVAPSSTVLPKTCHISKCQ